MNFDSLLLRSDFMISGIARSWQLRFIPILECTEQRKPSCSIKFAYWASFWPGLNFLATKLDERRVLDNIVASKSAREGKCCTIGRVPWKTDTNLWCLTHDSTPYNMTHKTLLRHSLLLTRLYKLCLMSLPSHKNFTSHRLHSCQLREFCFNLHGVK